MAIPRSDAPYVTLTRSPLALSVAIVVGIGLIWARDTFLLPLPFLLDALTDEPAHAATALLYVSAATAAKRRGIGREVVLAAALGGTLIDLDHLPAIFGWDGLTVGTHRPYSHSLLSVCAVLLIARGLPSRARVATACVALAVFSHLMRDMATGGVPLLWPWPSDNVTVPHAVYTATLLLSGATIAVREWASLRRTAARVGQ